MENIQTNDVEAIRQARQKQMEEEINSAFSGPGELGLSKLSDEKRIKYGIPDSAWSAHATFNKVLVWQLPIDESAAYGGGLILKTDQTLSRELQEAPRGVIVSAGLTALDHMRSHGIDVGHTVSFTHLAPFRKRLPAIAGKVPTLVILNDGDIFDSEELAQNLKSRKCRIIAKTTDEGIEHLFCDENGRIWNPSSDLFEENN